MENIESLWQQLENSVPECMEFVPNASVEVSQLQKKNQFLAMALVGLGIVAGVALIYFVFEEKRKEVQRRM